MTDLNQIAGHCTVKRALEVAAVGNHSVILIGPEGVGKGLLIEAAFSLGVGPIQPHQSCWCGHYFSISRQCVCSSRALARYWRQLERLQKDTDIHIEVAEVPFKELSVKPSQRGSTAEALARINAAEKRAPHTMAEYLAMLDAVGNRILEMATRRIGLSVNAVERILRVADSIAALGHYEGLPARAVAEAIQYRCLRLGTL